MRRDAHPPASNLLTMRSGPVKTIAIVNQKGGCGKTTTAINLSAALASRGFSTLLVDLDPQSHCAAGLGIPEERIELDVGDALLAPRDRPPKKSRLTWRIAHNLDLVPSRMRLAGIEASRGGLADLPERERRLGWALEALDGAIEEDALHPARYDAAVLDCPPTIGLLTYNALAAADEVLIPVETSYFSLRGAAKQVQTVRSLTRRFGRNIEVRLLATIHNPDSTLSRDLLRELRDRFGDAVLPCVVRADDQVREAASLGRTVLDFAPESTGAQDHVSLGEWLIQRAGIEKVGTPSPQTASTTDATTPAGEGEKTAESGASRVSPVAGPSGAFLGTGAHASAKTNVATPYGEAAPNPDRAESTRQRIADLAARAKALRERVDRGTLLTRQSAKPVAIELRSDPEDAPQPMPAPPQTAPGENALRSLLGVRATSRGLLFVQPLSIGRCVRLAGDFNGWNPAKSEMKPSPELGVHELHVECPPGEYEYRMVVDGVWQNDKHNTRTRWNGFGIENNVAPGISKPQAAGSETPRAWTQSAGA